MKQNIEYYQNKLKQLQINEENPISKGPNKLEAL
jgi:hypothetical protein